METKEYFPGIGKIKFEGKDSKNPMAFIKHFPIISLPPLQSKSRNVSYKSLCFLYILS